MIEFFQKLSVFLTLFPHAVLDAAVTTAAIAKYWHDQKLYMLSIFVIFSVAYVLFW